MPEATTCRVSVGTLRSRLKAIPASLAMASASNPNGATSFFQSSRQFEESSVCRSKEISISGRARSVRCRNDSAYRPRLSQASPARRAQAYPREDSLYASLGYDAQCERTSPEAVFLFMQPYAKREDVEVFWILALTAERRVIPNRPISVTRWLLNQTFIHPRELFRPALHLNAASVILARNHPSGGPTPSAEDRMITSQLVDAGTILDIGVFDHVIVTIDRFVSFAQDGLLR